MAERDRYELLRSVVRLANAAKLPYPARLRTLARFFLPPFRFTSFTVYILDEEKQHLTLRISDSGPPTGVPCLIPLGEGAAGRCAATNKPLRAERELLHADEWVGPADAAWLLVPVPEGKSLCGVIACGLPADDLPGRRNLFLVPELLVELGGLIQRLRISRASRRRVRNLTVLSELGQLLNRSLPPAALVPLIVNSCHQYSGACCSLLRLLPGTGLPAGLQRACRRRLRHAVPELLAAERSLVDQVLASGEPAMLQDSMGEANSPCAAICIPLSFEGKLLGTLTFFGKEERSCKGSVFVTQDRELFESMATLIANALAGSATYQQMVELTAENDQKVKELTLLYRLSNTMLSTIRLNKLVHLILTALTSGSASLFDRAMLFLINERAGIMQGMLGVTRGLAGEPNDAKGDFGDIMASGWRISEEEMSRQHNSEFSRQVRATRLELSRSHNIASRAVLEKRLIYVSDANREKRIDREIVKRFGIDSFAVAPLLAREQVVGVVVVDNPISGKPISQDDLRFLQLFTNQAGMAIENSILYNRIEDANHSLRDAQERLIHGERLAAVGELAAGIAHELKGPLVSIGGFAARLGKKLAADSAGQECVTMIVREVQRLEKILSEILTFSRKTSICYVNCNAVEAIEDALAIVLPALKETGVKVSKQFPRRAINLLGDCQQLKQIFINLFFNSLEAMPGGGELAIAVSRARLDGKPAVSIRVSDTGGGIPADVLASIFNPFFTTKETGTGLGLPIANRIVVNHGGRIEVDSRAGEGVEFNVLLPIQP